MRGFYIGRFQPYHNGHHHMVEEIADDVDELVLGIGSAGDSHTHRNPFTAGERVMMVTKSLADLDVTTYVVPIEDLERNSVWVSHVQSMSPKFDVAYSNNPSSSACSRKRASKSAPRRCSVERCWRSELRQRMIRGDGWRPLVPDEVVATIEEIDGVDRIRQVSSSDANGADASIETDRDGSTADPA
ncbi:nicotinamide-nucleotide adenylyltransferase [Halobaculum halobium]|uniref:nicotinamide-nucleotide adenylyltransferase n=1 Tax=Halobaculum halobium TaxID=3032281 RepID=UPI00361D7C9A